jgi:hypothetical protein
VYTFSWLEERQCSDHLSANNNLPNQGYNHHGINSASCASSKDETDEMLCNNQDDSHLSAREADHDKSLKRKKIWTPEADARLKQLKEKDKLPWSQIKKHFPNRTEGAIKVRYSTTLKDSTFMSCVPTSRTHSDRSSSFSPSPEPDLEIRAQHPFDTATERTSRSRPARARRAVERYSP